MIYVYNSICHKNEQRVPKYPSDNDIITVHTGHVTGPRGDTEDQEITG